MKIKNYLWTLPFFSFFAGYTCLQYVSNVNQLEAPAILGRQLQDVAVELSKKNLNLRIISQKDDSDLPQGTILSQTPIAGQKIKPHQALYIVISKKPEMLLAPSLIGKPNNCIEKELKAMGIRSKSHYFASNCPNNSCIAQLPAPGVQLEENKVITYLSCENKKPVLMPDLKNKSIPDVIEFLQKCDLKPEIMHASRQSKDHKCNKNCLIVNQRPLAGSIVLLESEKPLLVQLQVETRR